MGKGILDAVGKFTLMSKAISVAISGAGSSIMVLINAEKNNARDVVLA